MRIEELDLRDPFCTNIEKLVADNGWEIGHGRDVIKPRFYVRAFD